MYRDNEASRVGDVLSCKLAGDRPGLVAAAVRFWLSPAQGDEATSEVWQAILDGGVVVEAVEAVLALVRDRQLIRSAAFIDVVETLVDPTVLLELATSVLAAAWPAHPYLAAVFVRLVELQQEPVLWRFIKAHRSRLREDTAAWTAVGFILTTTRIGDRFDIDDWFADLSSRTAVPTWIVAAYATVVFQLPEDHPLVLGEIARTKATLIPDETELLVVMLRVLERLAGYDTDLPVIEKHIERIAKARGVCDAPLHLSRDVLEHPIVRYANSAKHKNRVVVEDFEYLDDGAQVSPAAKANRSRPFHWRLVKLVQELQRRTAKCAHVLTLFYALLEAPRGDPKVVELYREMRRARPKELPGIDEAWGRLVKARIPWLTRLRLEYF